MCIGASAVFTNIPKESLCASPTATQNVVSQVNGPPVTESQMPQLDSAVVSKLKQYAEYALMVSMLRPETSDPILKLLSAFDDSLVTPMQPLSEHLGKLGMLIL